MYIWGVEPKDVMKDMEGKQYFDDLTANFYKLLLAYCMQTNKMLLIEDKYDINGRCGIK